MKVMIFNDKNNFEGSLSIINKDRPQGTRRFWQIEKYHGFFFRKVCGFMQPFADHVELVKTYVYTGKYNKKAMDAMKKYCGKDIRMMNDLIRNEEDLLQGISNTDIQLELKKRIETHVDSLKRLFEDIKSERINAIEKQEKHSKGQVAMTEYLNELPFTQLKTTPLKHTAGYIHQKGVDVLISTDLVNLAHCNAYDIAIVLGGDADLLESIKL